MLNIRQTQFSKDRHQKMSEGERERERERDLGILLISGYAVRVTIMYW